MSSTAPRSVTSRRFAWLLWLALLLPIAQVAAAGHALTHLGNPTGSSSSSDLEGKKALAQPDGCGLCIVAAAMGAGALPGTPPTWPHMAAAHEQAQCPLPTFAPGPLARAYLSRAPPSSLS